MEPFLLFLLAIVVVASILYFVPKRKPSTFTIPFNLVALAKKHK